jgi:ubiquinone/menaquinone biosynthesis C-methylase UbiE
MEPMKLRPERLVLGFRGLALLRGWPFGDPREAERHIQAMNDVLRGDPDVIDIAGLELDDAYAAWSETYDEPNPLIDAEEPVVRGYLADIPSGRSVDLGCGTGRLTRFLVDLGHDVVGIDRSLEMLSVADASVTPATFLRGDMLHLPLADATVDLATCSLALTHVADLRDPLSEIARVVRPGGSAILSDIHPLAVATGGHAFFKAAVGSRGVTRNRLHWTSEYLEAFRSVGLQVEACAEPLFEPRFADDVSDEELRAAILGALPGLPFALVWLLRRR